MKAYLITLFINFNVINCLAAHGRSPAVEPEVSLELEYQSDVQAENVKRYNFDQGKDQKQDQRQPSATEEPVVEIKVNAVLPPIEQALPDQSNGLESGLLLFIFLLPVFMVFGINKLLKRKSSDIDADSSNIVALKTQAQKDGDDDMNFPKAS